MPVLGSPLQHHHHSSLLASLVGASPNISSHGPQMTPPTISLRSISLAGVSGSNISSVRAGNTVIKLKHHHSHEVHGDTVISSEHTPPPPPVSTPLQITPPLGVSNINMIVKSKVSVDRTPPPPPITTLDRGVPPSTHRLFASGGILLTCL